MWDNNLRLQGFAEAFEQPTADPYAPNLSPPRSGWEARPLHNLKRKRNQLKESSHAGQQRIPVIAIDQIHESTTNPRKTFDEAKLWELAESIKHNGLIQPITVQAEQPRLRDRRRSEALPCRATAESFSLFPARIVEIDDAQALEWQLVENSQRVDVHPYEEAQGFPAFARRPRI